MDVYDGSRTPWRIAGRLCVLVGVNQAENSVSCYLLEPLPAWCVLQGTRQSSEHPQCQLWKHQPKQVDVEVFLDQWAWTALISLSLNPCMKTMICKTGGKNTISKQNNKPQGFNCKPWAVSSKSYSSGWSVASAIQFLLCFQAWGGTQELPVLHFFSQAFEISQLFSFNCVSLPPLRNSSLIGSGEFKAQYHPWALCSSLGCFSLCRKLFRDIQTASAAPRRSRTHSAAHITVVTDTSQFSGPSVYCSCEAQSCEMTKHLQK